MARHNWAWTTFVPMYTYTSSSTSSTTIGVSNTYYEEVVETPVDKVKKAIREYETYGKGEVGEVAMHTSMMRDFDKVLSGPEERWPNGVRLYKWDVGQQLDGKVVTVIFDKRMPLGEYFIGPFGSWTGDYDGQREAQRQRQHGEIRKGA